jgi:hypothetical protein
MGESAGISAFTYTPRQDQWEGGIILRGKFEVSRDGKSCETVADDVPFDNVVNSRQQQVVRLPNRVDARYFRLTALQTVKDEDLAWASQPSVIVDPATGSSSTKYSLWATTCVQLTPFSLHAAATRNFRPA